MAAMAGFPALAQQDNLLQKVKERGALRVCSASYSPWNVKNPVSNEWEGIVPDIVKEIGEVLKIRIEWVDSTWATIIPSVQTDKCDMVGAAVWTSPQRAELVSFTRAIGGDGMSIFVPANATVRTLSDVDQPGKVVTVASGSGDERVARSLFKNAEVRAVVSERPHSAVMELAAGRADAASGAYAGTAQFLKANPQMRVKPVEGLQFNYTPFAFAAPAKEYFFRDYLNVVISNLEASGKLQQIREQWTKLPH
jgi:cyclohexadienyl dehydratase